MKTISKIILFYLRRERERERERERKEKEKKERERRTKRWACGRKRKKEEGY